MITNADLGFARGAHQKRKTVVSPNRLAGGIPSRCEGTLSTRLVLLDFEFRVDGIVVRRGFAIGGTVA